MYPNLVKENRRMSRFNPKIIRLSRISTDCAQKSPQSLVSNQLKRVTSGFEISYLGRMRGAPVCDSSGGHMNPPPPLGQAEEEGNHPGMDGGLPPPALGGGVDRPPQPGRGGSAPISHY